MFIAVIWTRELLIYLFPNFETAVKNDANLYFADYGISIIILMFISLLSLGIYAVKYDKDRNSD